MVRNIKHTPSQVASSGSAITIHGCHGPKPMCLPVLSESITLLKDDEVLSLLRSRRASFGDSDAIFARYQAARQLLEQDHFGLVGIVKNAVGQPVLFARLEIPTSSLEIDQALDYYMCSAGFTISLNFTMPELTGSTPQCDVEHPRFSDPDEFLVILSIELSRYYRLSSGWRQPYAIEMVATMAENLLAVARILQPKIVDGSEPEPIGVFDREMLLAFVNIDFKVTPS